ncbi:MAG: hypothetical protein KF861_12365 [Planctomycetaceae bacterium]|nr:hypothetical protein [Planctomycetaceae bacterium]
MASAAHEIRLAVLGDRPRASAWFDAVIASERHPIVATLGANVEGVPAVEHWQVLAADPRLDAALVFTSTDEIATAVSKLAARGKGIVIDGECPLPSPLIAELGLLDAEATAPVVPFFEWRAFPVLDRLRQVVAEGHLGQLILLRIERTLALDSPSGMHRMLDDGAVQPSLMMDVDLLRWIGGDYSQVSCFRTGLTAEGFAGQTLNLAGEGLPDATCIDRSGTEPAWRYEVQGINGTAAVEFVGAEARLTFNGERSFRQPDRRPDASLCLRLLDDGLNRRPGSLRWQDRGRIHEIQEAMQRSLRRRRTIDLHFEETSERSQFKTTMATVGCFVLVYTFLASVFLLLAGALFDPRDQIQREAEAAGFVVSRDDFDASLGALSTAGEQRLSAIADRWENSATVVIVEPAAAIKLDGTAPLDDPARLEIVRRRLNDFGLTHIEERTVVRPLAGRAIQRLMLLGRIIAFAPLAVFLALQLLLSVARPHQTAEKPKHPDASSV